MKDTGTRFIICMMCEHMFPARVKADMIDFAVPEADHQNLIDTGGSFKHAPLWRVMEGEGPDELVRIVFSDGSFFNLAADDTTELPVYMDHYLKNDNISDNPDTELYVDRIGMLFVYPPAPPTETSDE